MSSPAEQGDRGIPAEILEVLRRALQKPRTRAAVLRDPRGYLARHGIGLSPDDEIFLYERARTPEKKGKEVQIASPLISGTFVALGTALVADGLRGSLEAQPRRLPTWHCALHVDEAGERL